MAVAVAVTAVVVAAVVEKTVFHFSDISTSATRMNNIDNKQYTHLTLINPHVENIE